MLNELTETWRYRSVIQNFVKTSLAVRYRRSFLGYLWTVLSPLLKYAIMGVVFEIIGRFSMPNYYGFMFTGSVFFGFVSSVIIGSTSAFLANEYYIKKIYVPKLAFVMNVVFFELANFMLVLVAIIGLLLAMGQIQVGPAIILVVPAILITLVALVGVSALFAVATVYFRDLQHLTDILFQALLFATPIFYPETVFQKNELFARLAQLNPLYYFVTLFRMPLVDNSVPGIHVWVYCIVFSLLTFAAGIFTVSKFNNRIIFKL